MCTIFQVVVWWLICFERMSSLQRTMAFMVRNPNKVHGFQNQFHYSIIGSRKKVVVVRNMSTVEGNENKSHDDDDDRPITVLQNGSTSKDTTNKSNDNEPSTQKKKKKKKFVINKDILETGENVISSTGNLSTSPSKPSPSVKSNLGVPSRKQKSSTIQQKGKPKKSTVGDKIQRQRTAGGTIDSTLQAGITSPSDQPVQVLVAKRGSKEVTIIRGLTSTMEDRKIILKELKKKLGGGGTLVEGVLEIQGSHDIKVLDYLLTKGYLKAKIVK